jgi:hypothetical protein
MLYLRLCFGTAPNHMVRCSISLGYTAQAHGLTKNQGLSHADVEYSLIDYSIVLVGNWGKAESPVLLDSRLTFVGHYSGDCVATVR